MVCHQEFLLDLQTNRSNTEEITEVFFTSTIRLVTVILRFEVLLQYPVIKVSMV